MLRRLTLENLGNILYSRRRVRDATLTSGGSREASVLKSLLEGTFFELIVDEWRRVYEKILE